MATRVRGLACVLLLAGCDGSPLRSPTLATPAGVEPVVPRVEPVATALAASDPATVPLTARALRGEGLEERLVQLYNPNSQILTVDRYDLDRASRRLAFGLADESIPLECDCPNGTVAFTLQLTELSFSDMTETHGLGFRGRLSGSAVIVTQGGTVSSPVTFSGQVRAIPDGTSNTLALTVTARSRRAEWAIELTLGGFVPSQDLAHGDLSLEAEGLRIQMMFKEIAA